MKIPVSLALKLYLCLVAVSATTVAGRAATLTASVPAVNFVYSTSTPQPPPVNVVVTASDGTTPALTAVITPGSGTPAGLFPQPPIADGTIQVGFNLNAINVGVQHVYTATLVISAAGFAPLSLPVSFSVGVPFSIAASPTSLTFNSPGITVQSVAISGNVGTDGFLLSATTVTGGNWLTVTTNQYFTPATLSVTVNPTSLAGGTYSGTILITPTSGAALSIPVTLTVGANTLLANPATMSFTYIMGGTVPPSQPLGLSSGLTGDTYTAQASSTGNWLLVNGVTSKISGALPATVNITVSPASLVAGTYTGTITVTDAAGGSQVVAVTLVVTGISSVANPTSLTFVAQVGGVVPPPQTVLISGFGVAAYTATVTGSFISVSSSSGPAPGQITVTASPIGLVAGTYAGKVEINLSGHIQDIPVTLTVSADPVLTTSAGSYFFTYSGANGGGAPPTPVVLTVGSSGTGSGVTFTYATGVPSWLTITHTNNLVTPVNLTLTVIPQILPTGLYVADIILTPTAADGVPVIVPVMLQISEAPQITPNPTSVSFTAAAGAGPQTSTVQVFATTTTAFTASASTVSGGNWLSVAPTDGVATYTYTPLLVTADATSLAAGTYQGTVTLTTTGGVLTLIPVTFTVTGGTGPISISPSTLTFSYTQNGVVPPAQTLQITGTQSFTASAGTSTGGSWLSVTPASGVGNATLTVSVNPTGLAPATYSGSITVTPAGSAPQTVAVTLKVSLQGALTATPNTLAFSYTSGNPAPAAQAVSVTSSGAAVTFTATATSSGWLAVTPTSATTPASVSISVNPVNLGAGTYQGSVALSGSGGSVNIGVTLTVVAPFPNISKVVNAASYLAGGVSPGELVTIFGTSLGPITGVGATISKGFIPTTLANVQVTFNGYPGPVLYASATQINTIVPYELAGSSNASVEVMFGTARSNQASLAVVSAAPGIFSANASGTGGGAILDLSYQLVSAANPVSVGSIIQVFATGQGQTNPAGVDGLIEPTVLPLPAPILNAAATIGGIPATIEYVGAAPGLVAGALQVNIVVPPGVTSGAAPLFISFGGGESSQVNLTVAIK